MFEADGQKSRVFQDFISLTYGYVSSKGGLTSECILTLVSLPTKVAKSLPWVENLNKLSTAKGGKFKLSAQGWDLVPFVGKNTFWN